MPWTKGNAQTSGFEIVLSNFEHFESQFYDVLHEETHWKKAIPQASVETDIDGGATSTSYGTRDWSGQGQFAASQSGDVPTVGQNVAKPTTIPILVANVAAKISREDIRVYQHAHSGRLDSELPQVMRQACDRHVEGVFFFGDAAVGFDAWIDADSVPIVQAPLNGGATSRKWVDKTPDEILADVNSGISQVFTTTKEIHLPDTIFIPTAQFADIAGRRITDTNMTVLEFIKKNNIYTATTGKELSIQSLPHLTAAGAGATDRMVAIEMKPRNHKLPFPIPFTLLAPQEVGYDVHLLAEYKFGSYHNRYPLSMLYMDEI